MGWIVIEGATGALPEAVNDSSFAVAGSVLALTKPTDPGRVITDIISISTKGKGTAARTSFSDFENRATVHPDSLVAYWGGAYSDSDGFPHSSANNYIRLKIGSRKILIISLEFFPRNKVINWAKSIHDSYIDHECGVTTHGYMDNVAVRRTRTQQFGPNTYSLSDDGTSNSGQQIFSGNSNASSTTGSYTLLTGENDNLWTFH